MSRTASCAALGAVVCVSVAVSGGCTQRPVVATSPILRTSFTTAIDQAGIDKVDLLFDIDNSASMGDKQQFLARAIPDLITRLVTPNCVDDHGKIVPEPVRADGTCSAGQPEFPPVRDLHIGIVSSSLGPRLGIAEGDMALCPPAGFIQLADGTKVSAHNDDQGHLLDRASNSSDPAAYADSPLPAADPGHFLDWFPAGKADVDARSGPQTPITSAPALQTDFQELVAGVHQFGCGIESQLESWYRFLIQPDPYASLAVDDQQRAQWRGVDTTILAQRADFLRPDSLVAVIVLSDENDSEVDVRSLGGKGWTFMRSDIRPWRATAVCATNPNDPGCTSCGFPGHESDPSCQMGLYPEDASDWADNMNLRHVHQKEKYGVSVQFPIERYVLGLTSPKVPDREGEYPTDANGNYPPTYQGNDHLDCTNPLFAASLPRPPPDTDANNWNPSKADLCALQPGTRRKDLVFYAHIGGVPHELLQNADGTQKDVLDDADWQLILGKDPENLDSTGIDPHMVESFKPRTDVIVPPGGHPVSDPMAPQGADPISGREWITDSKSPSDHPGVAVDLEYACTFKLTVPRPCDDGALKADPTLNESCDCRAPLPPGAFTSSEIPSVCESGKATTQDHAKAYPTIRELLLAKQLGKVDGANEGIVSSLCPIHTEEQTPGDPLFGYRPAMTSIVNRLSKALTPQCLPQRLGKTMNADGGFTVPCLVLGTFPTSPDAPTDCSRLPGYQPVESAVLERFKYDQHQTYKAGGAVGTDPSTELTCELKQLAPNSACDKGSEVGWCYVDDGTAKGGCPQAILFTQGALTKGVITNLQCLEASPAPLGGTM